MNNKKALRIAFLSLTVILLLTAAAALLTARLRGGAFRSATDAPYPYSWTENRDGTITLKLNGSAEHRGVWTLEGESDMTEVSLGETKRGMAQARLSPITEGREELGFLLQSDGDTLAAARFIVETQMTGETLSASVADHWESVMQRTERFGRDTETPFTIWADESGLRLRIDDPGAYSEETGAATERWSVVSTDALVAKPVLASVDETGVEYIIFTYENGDAVVTASSEAANVTDTFTVEAREGTLLLNAHSTGAYEPPAPVSEKEWNALLAETAESLAASRLDGTQLSPDAADIPAEPDTETEEQTEPEPGQPETSSVPYVMP